MLLSEPLFRPRTDFSLNFDGVNDALSIANIPQFNTGDYTISFWLKEFNITVLDYSVFNLNNILIITVYNNAGNQGIELANSRVGGNPNAIGSYMVSGGAANFNNLNKHVFYQFTFRHVVATKQLSMFRNGIHQHSNNYPFDNIPASGNATIGSNLARTASFYKGQMDEFRIWGRALSNDEILHNYQNYKTPQNNTDLLIRYKFDKDTLNTGSAVNCNATPHNFISTPYLLRT